MDNAPLVRWPGDREEEEDEIQTLSRSKALVAKVCNESKKLWYLAGPSILIAVFQFSLFAVTQTFSGHLGATQLAAVAMGNLVISGIGYGFLMGMGSALETLCGQAFGAGQLHMLGIYMQRSWIILTVTATLISPVFVFAGPILKLLGQTAQVSEVAGKFSIWIIPQLFAYGFNFPIQKFLQSQSKVIAMAWMSGACLAVHILLSWLCIMKLGWGLVGAAITLNFSWWLLVFVQLAYILLGSCPGAWTGFSCLAFKDLGGFIKISMASAIMLCLEYWFVMILIVLVGHLKTNAEIDVDATAICLNLDGWIIQVPIGFMAAISVRVSNELGAGRPKAAKFSVGVAVATSLTVGIFFMVIILITRTSFPALFTNDPKVMAEVSRISSFLALTIVLNSIQPVLSGVAVGAGWQAVVSYVNLGCYFLVGLSAAALLGYKFDLGVKGIWGGMLLGFVAQMIILSVITFRTDWNKEASLAHDRVSTWEKSARVTTTNDVF
ncbi:protein DETOXIFICATION 33-like [Magnolia sinica]|uniref:protein DETOXIFICATION 33-like n=1 Tax=Magnolia sinica TaxID=86752 RepID=UPI002659EC9E|nr:protein DETOXIFICATION 33-like [Magnolia sinica]